MAGRIICWIVSFGCAALFYAIGAYAQKRELPMWFWSGTEVKASEITDVKRYNKENAVMWKTYALWYAAAGIAAVWSPLAVAVILVLSCTVGIAQLIWTYQKIYKKYSTDQKSRL